MIDKINQHIEIVRARDVHLSSMGLKSGAMIQHTLSNYYQRVGLSSVASVSDLEDLVNSKPDLVILGLKRIHDNGEFIWLCDYLDAHGINYSGSARQALELDLNKAKAKRLMQYRNIATAEFFVARPGQFTTYQGLPAQFPLFIKPYDQGGGMGIGPDSVVHNFPAFQQKVQSIFNDYGAGSLVETYLPGREFSVALLGNGYEEELAAMPVELITKPNEFGDCILGQEVKSEDNERAIYITNDLVRQQIAQLGRDAYRALGGRDYGRIDIRMDASGTPHFIEANLTPGIAHNDFVSYFTRACELNLGMDYDAMILRIAELGLARSANSREIFAELNNLSSSAFPFFETSPKPATV